MISPMRTVRNVGTFNLLTVNFMSDSDLNHLMEEKDTFLTAETYCVSEDMKREIKKMINEGELIKLAGIGLTGKCAH